MRRILFVPFFAVILISLLFLASCTEDPSEPEVTISLSRVNVEMNVGDVYALEATISPKDYVSGISWVSSDPDVATCEGGLVTAHSPGKCHVMATLDSGEYFVSYVTVNEKIESRIYMTVGETVELDRSIAPTLSGGVFTCVDPSVASCASDGERVLVSATGGGRSNVVISDGRSAVTVCEVVVLTEEGGYNVELELPDTPLYVPFVKNSYETGVSLKKIDVEYELTRDYLDGGLVRIKLIFHYEKAYDSEGDSATNATGFTFEIYSGEKDGLLRSYDVIENGVSVDGAEPFTYEYEFDAVLDDGDGERSYTFVIVGAEKEDK